MSRYSDLLRYYSPEYQPSVTKEAENDEPYIPFEEPEVEESLLTKPPIKAQPNIVFPDKEVEDDSNDLTYYKGISRKDFVEQNYDYFESTYGKEGLDPVVHMAQAILEGKINRGGGKGSGDSALALKGHALFGVKAGKGDDQGEYWTWESRDGVRTKERAKFAKYKTYKDSVNRQIQFLKDNGRRYSGLFNENDRDAYLAKLQASGYATDPNYSSTLRSIIEKDILPYIKK